MVMLVDVTEASSLQVQRLVFPSNISPISSTATEIIVPVPILRKLPNLNCQKHNSLPAIIKIGHSDVVVRAKSLSSGFWKDALCQIMEFTGFDKTPPLAWDRSKNGTFAPILLIAVSDESRCKKWLQIVKECPVKLVHSGLKIVFAGANLFSKSKIMYKTNDGAALATIIIGKLATISNIIAERMFHHRDVNFVFYDLEGMASPTQLRHVAQFLRYKVLYRTIVAASSFATDVWRTVLEDAVHYNYELYYLLDSPLREVELSKGKVYIYRNIYRSLGKNLVDQDILIGFNNEELAEFKDLHILRKPMSGVMDLCHQIGMEMFRVAVMQPSALSLLDFKQNINLVNWDLPMGTRIHHQLGRTTLH